MKKLLVLGIGNLLLSDEGVGVHAVKALMEERWPDDVDLLEGGTFTQDIFYIFKNYEKLLVLDCVRGSNGPGTIYRLSEDDIIKDESQNLSVHDIDMLDSLRMAELMGHKPQMRVVGMEPLKIDWDMEMTDPIKKVFPEFLEIIRQEIRTMLED
ncbi:NiFeSe hydrogenase maturation protease [Desulfovibrio inopinatus]|uniref:NiFeSe hydrogenase maturation protease n=1 Tax=Desulfovibrio inopinatus TaxID=102109 RepID=UPI0004040AE6|nr:NiFeSe hydrogenase maturation protease [Desulfovibrio inopinatus]